MNRQAILITVILLVITGALAVLYFSTSSGNDDNVLQAVPSGAAIVIRFENEQNLYDLYKDNNLIPSLLGDGLMEEMGQLKKLFLDNPYTAREFNNKKIILSIHKVKADQAGALFIAAINDKKTFSDVNLIFKEFITPKNFITEREFENTKVYEFNFSAAGKTLAFCIEDGLLIAGYTAFLVEDALRQLKKSTPFLDLNSLQFSKTALSKGAVAEVFINYQKLPELTGAFVRTDITKFLEPIKKFAGWSVLGLNFKHDAFLLSGFTVGDTTQHPYINLLAGQSPLKTELPEVLPERTSAFFHFGVSDYSLFLSNYKHYIENKKGLSKWNSQVSAISKKYGISLEEEVKRMTGTEFALCLSDGGTDNLKGELTGIIKLRNKEKASKLFSDLFYAENFLQKKNDSIENYKGFLITPLYISDLMPLFFGDLFTYLQSNYYTLVNDYLIVADNTSTLKSFVDDYISLQTLNKSEAYQQFTTGISAESNFYFYANTEKSTPMVNRLVNQRLASSVSKEKTVLPEFYALAFQVSVNGSSFFTNLYYPQQKGVKQETSLEWKTELDNQVSMKPAIVINHETMEKEIMVQDDANILYLISNTGKILWRKQLPAKIISEVYQVDFYKNDKLQYLFNTQRQLFLIDRNSNMMPGYPLRLSTSATCGLALFDYDNDKNYRIFISCDNRAVFGYTINGRPVEGWNPKLNVGILLQPLQHVNISGRDYLFANNTDGDFFFFSRKGEVIAKYLDEEKIRYRNPFIADIQPEFTKCRFISTDTTGTIKSIFFDGRRLYKHVGIWTNNHFFNYQNIAGDQKREAIFADKNQLFVYETDTSLLWNYQFLYDITLPPQCFPVSSTKYAVGVTSTASNQVFVFNENGSIVKGFPVAGSTPFSITDLKNFGATNLVVAGTDKTLYVYRLK